MKIIIDHVDKRRCSVAAWVVTAKTNHRLGHIRGEGWFCNCSLGKRCGQIQHVKELVPAMEEK